ncbi:cryptochrome DASH, chloroplastic/mitochondrial-like [Hibiscus syriacus]|uniref:cryptochrome DASH, chloroplastic/mitochondrial-like n=1 Tax=Hibiscus syriacus TaxID=106335 RepID=UPI001924AFC2|nr:cryptochrome DASH, chloroplastic/mitochondrial-like [Hibiscus syriacus]
MGNRRTFFLSCAQFENYSYQVYAHKETCSEELRVERSVAGSLRQVVLPPTQGNSSRSSSTHSPKLELSWGSTLYHINDLPFNINSLPDVYTQFRKSVEAKCTVQGCIRLLKSLGPPPSIDDWGIIPSIKHLGLHLEKTTKGMRFMGGEAAALGRVTEYFWKKDLLKCIRRRGIRNEMLDLITRPSFLHGLLQEVSLLDSYMKR